MARMYFNLATAWAITAAAVVIGCGQESPRLSAPLDEASLSELDRSGTTSIIVVENAIRFDPATCSAEEKLMNWGLGSIGVKVLGRRDRFCIFEYTYELEGGYETYRCRVPLSTGLVEVRQVPIQVNTSLPVGDCEIIDRGNYLLHQHQRE